MQCLACNRCSGPFTVIMDYISIILNCQLKSKWNSVLSHWLKRKDDFQAGAMILLLCFLNLWTCGYFKAPEEDCRIYKKKDDKLETERTPAGQHLCFIEVLAPWVFCACLVTSNSLWPHELQPFRLLCPWVLQARILEWVAVSYSKGSSWPRDQTLISCVSCIEGRFFTHWAIREA